MKRTILSLTLALFTLLAYAQTIEKYEPAILEVYYDKIMQRDTLEINKTFWNTPMVLRMGRTASIWMSTKIMWADSLHFYNFDLYREVYNKMNPPGSAYTPLGSFEREYVFKNMPRGKNTVFQYFNLEDRIYTEEIEKQDWNLLDSLTNIIGYDCYLAECDYRGRHWFAWYAPDLPLAEGPWKLGGLPGLILDAYDAKQHYRYTATGINDKVEKDVGIIIYRRRKPIQMTRESYMNERYYYITEVNLGKQLRQSGAYGLRQNGKDEDDSKTIRLCYDFEEKDYSHKRGNKR